MDLFFKILRPTDIHPTITASVEYRADIGDLVVDGEAMEYPQWSGHVHEGESSSPRPLLRVFRLVVNT